MKKTKTIGASLLDLEIILDELVDRHELQYGDILSLVLSYLTVHRPDAQETYLNGEHPVFFYGVKE